MPALTLAVIAGLTYYLVGQLLSRYDLSENQRMLAQVGLTAIIAYLANLHVLPLLGLSSITKGMF